MYGNREEQGQLLQQVLTASDTDADEERIPGEGSRPVSAQSTGGAHRSYTTGPHIALSIYCLSCCRVAGKRQTLRVPYR